ncbi:MAG TPA: glycosyltransferase [Candidatus Dormibacteraeota bacterium]|nr:glycosyltransferase [Candidatus Dormibacteraeota bacterium]
MRVGFFTEVDRPVVNGVVASVEGLARGLRSRGHEVYCFAPRMPGGDEDSEVFFRMPSLPLPTRTPYRLTVPLVGRRSVRSVIKRLHLVHVHSPFVTGWMGLRYARRYGMPIVYTYHTQLEAYTHYVPFDPSATRFATETLTRTFGNSVDAVVVPTDAMRKRLRSLGVTTRIAVVPSGIDVAHFASGRRDEALRASLGAADGCLLLFVGRLAKEKSLDVLLRGLAIARRDDVHLAIAGDGPAADELRELARELGLTARVRFMGEVQRERLPDLYASSDAFVFPSTSETQGLVLAEALAAGLPVIAADAPQNRDVLDSGAELVPPTAAAFAASIERAVPATEERRAAARAAGARFSLETQIERILDLYNSLSPPLRFPSTA